MTTDKTIEKVKAMLNSFDGTNLHGQINISINNGEIVEIFCTSHEIVSEKNDIKVG